MQVTHGGEYRSCYLFLVFPSSLANDLHQLYVYQMTTTLLANTKKYKETTEHLLGENNWYALVFSQSSIKCSMLHVQWFKHACGLNQSLLTLISIYIALHNEASSLCTSQTLFVRCLVGRWHILFHTLLVKHLIVRTVEWVVMHIFNKDMRWHLRQQQPKLMSNRILGPLYVGLCMPMWRVMVSTLCYRICTTV